MQALLRPEIWIPIAGVVAVAVLSGLVSFLRRRAKRTPETWDDDVVEAFDDALDPYTKDGD